jgi:hypothetical protein
MNFGAQLTGGALTLQGQMGEDMLACNTVAWTTNNIAVCSSAAGKGHSGKLAIGPAADAKINSFVGFSYDAPVVTFITLNNGPTIGGQVMTVLGMNFGTKLSTSNQVAISVNKIQCQTSAFISSSTVTCVTPSGLGRGLDVQIDINQIKGQFNGMYEYDARFLAPPKDVTYTINVGDVLNAQLIAKGEDFGSEIALVSFDGGSTPYFAGYSHSLSKVSQNTKDPSSVFTWAPSTTGKWNACFGLFNANGIQVDTTCFVIEAITCQHMVMPGETQESIARKYQISWKTIFYLNKNMKDLNDVRPGQKLNIGKQYTIQKGETLSDVVSRFGTTWYQLALVNPRKVDTNADVHSASASVNAMTLPGASYKTSSQVEGLSYCIVVEFEEVY